MQSLALDMFKSKKPEKPSMTDQVLLSNASEWPEHGSHLHFALRLENGDTVDSTFDKFPATFALHGNLLPGF